MPEACHLPPRCAARPADMCADHSLRLAQEVVAQNHFLCLLWLGGERGGKSGVTEQDGLAADGKGVFLVRLRPGKLDKLLVHQIVKGNLPLPFPAKLQNLIAGSIADYCLTKGVVLALDVLLIGFKVGHGNSPFLNNSAGRQHSLLSPLDCLSAKAGGAVNGGAYAPFILTVDWLGWLCYYLAVNVNGYDRSNHFRDPKRIPDANRSEKPAE